MGALLVMAGASCGSPRADAEPASPCAASASWFATPSFPSEVPGGANANDCSFHQFSWQAFIDLVQPAGGSAGLRTFETYMPDYGVFVPESTPVTPWGQQPPAPCTPTAAAAAADPKLGKRLFLRPRIGKGDGFDPNSELQATGQALYDQQKQVVYYSIWINQTEYDFITGCDFNNTSCITSAPPTTAITPGALEIKGSWRVFTGAAPKDMYTIRGVINSVGKDGKKATTCTPVTLGLVGFHLVTNTPLHPEFVWATFEHKSNAPDCSKPQPPPPGGWSFNNPACLVATNTTCSPNHSNPAPIPTQVCRVAPQGGGDAQNITNIQAINASVHQTLAQLLKTAPAQYAAMAIWQNYEMTGDLWTANGQLPPTASNEEGSLLAANTTMETYIQGKSPIGANQNCFTCHTQQQFVAKGPPPVPKGFPTGAPANFSHLWGFAQRTGGCSNGLPAACPVRPGAAKPAVPGPTRSPGTPPKAH